MTQQEALAAVREKLPQIAETIRLSRDHSVGYHYGHDDQFYIWDHTNHDSKILASSQHSWEHAISMIDPTRIETQPADTSVEAWF